MTSLRSTTIKVTLLLLCALALGVFAERELIHERVAYNFAPKHLLSEDDLQILQLRQACEGKGRSICAFYMSSEGEDFEEEHIKPTMRLIAGASAVVCVILLVIAAAIFIRALYSWLATRVRVAGMAARVNTFDGLPGVANLGQRLRSWQAERKFLRYRRLYDSGLLSEAEFEAKKRELKPLIMGSL